MYGPKAALLFVLVAAAACAPNIDLKQTLQVADVSSGWFDAGIVNGRKKIVPSVTLKLKKAPGTKLSWVALNGVFKAADGQPSDLDDDIYVQRVDFNGDEAGPITIQGVTGYTGEPPQSRADLLHHSQFRDMKARIFAKQSSAQWVELVEVPITRQLLTR